MTALPRSVGELSLFSSNQNAGNQNWPKRGDVRQDGFIYASRHFINGQWRQKWYKPEVFARIEENKRAKAKAARDANPVASRLRNKRWRSRNPHLVRAYKASRRILGNGFCQNANKEMISQIYLTAKRLRVCTGLDWHVDHIIPLVKGGLHHESNLQILPGAD